MVNGVDSSTSARAVRSEASVPGGEDVAKIDEPELPVDQFGLTCRGNHCQVSYGGRSVGAISASSVGSGDPRTITDINTVVSTHNRVVPLFPESLAPEDESCFEAELGRLIDEAQSYIFVQGYDLSHEDFVERLIEKAREGVQVVAYFHPPAKDGDIKSRLLDRLREASKERGLAGKLVVEEFSGTGNGKSDQAMHVKRVIADTASGSIAEVSGGINFGERSTLNVDTAWRTDGVAVLDSLRAILDHYPDSHDLPFDLERVPDAATVDKKTRQLLKKLDEEPVKIELARSGRRDILSPRTYTKKRFMERAAQGDKLVIGASDLEKPWMLSGLRTAVKNGSLVKVITPSEPKSAVKKAKSIVDAHQEALDELGIGVYRADLSVSDNSYLDLVLRELDGAIENGESIDVASFALTEPEIIDKLIEAHNNGCQVRVAVDDLNVGGVLTNQKAIALLTHVGIAVRAFTNDVAAKMGLERNDEHDVKLHAKVMILGGNRVLGGSANFSTRGMSFNVEDGRLVESSSVANAFRAVMFEPVWEHGLVIEPMETVSFNERTAAFEAACTSERIQDTMFVLYDIETTGFAAHHDERLLSISAVAYRIEAGGKIEVVKEFDGYALPGKNAVGRPYSIPWRAASVHGLTRDELEARGAKHVDETLSDFLDFMKEVANIDDKIVPVTYSLFDQRFLQQVLSRRRTAVAQDGQAGHFRMPSLCIDALALGQRVVPDANGYGLDEMASQLKVKTRVGKKHASLEDSHIAARIHGKLVHAGKLERIDEMLDSDSLLVRQPIRLSTSPRSFTGSIELEKATGKKLMVRRKDKKTGQFLAEERVLELIVEGRTKDAIEVTIVTGKEDEEKRQKAYLPIKDAVFRQAGPVFHALTEEGHEPPLETSRKPSRRRVPTRSSSRSKRGSDTAKVRTGFANRSSTQKRRQGAA